MNILLKKMIRYMLNKFNDNMKKNMNNLYKKVNNKKNMFKDKLDKLNNNV